MQKIYKQKKKSENDSSASTRKRGPELFRSVEEREISTVRIVRKWISDILPRFLTIWLVVHAIRKPIRKPTATINGLIIARGDHEFVFQRCWRRINVMPPPPGRSSQILISTTFDIIQLISYEKQRGGVWAEIFTRATDNSSKRLFLDGGVGVSHRWKMTPSWKWFEDDEI